MGCSDSKAGGAAGTASDTGGDAAVDRIEIDLQLSDSDQMDAPLWKLLANAAKPGAEKPSAEAVRAAVEADPDAAARPFAASSDWAPAVDEIVRPRDEAAGLYIITAESD